MQVSPPNKNVLINSLSQQQKLLQQLASAKRINSAADDAAGLQISNRLTSVIEAQQQGLRNLADGVSMANVYGQALRGVSENLFELERLSVAAGNGALSDADRQALQTEAEGYLTNIQRGLQTEFAGELLFQDRNLLFATGETKIAFATTDAGAALNNSNLFNLNFTDSAALRDSELRIRESQKLIGRLEAESGAVNNLFQLTINSLSQNQSSASAARSRITDIDYARASADRVVANFQTQASVSVTMQARVSSEQALSLLS
ncbi:MAG: flagellin [Alishewanella agri]|nr:flagellin [Alishewanella agri]